jgi:hypothetical protein
MKRSFLRNTTATPEVPLLFLFVLLSSFCKTLWLVIRSSNHRLERLFHITGYLHLALELHPENVETPVTGLSL